MRSGQVPKSKALDVIDMIQSQEVELVLAPNSLYVFQAVQYFVQFVETEYNNEVGPPAG